MAKAIKKQGKENQKPTKGARRANGKPRVKDDAGRPRLNLYGKETPEQFWAKIDNWLMKGCSAITIGHRLGCHSDTFNHFGIAEKRWGANTEYADFSTYKAHKIRVGDDTLRERQFDIAYGMIGKVREIKEDGTIIERTEVITAPSNAMLIWLGKNRLNQRDNADLTSGGKPFEGEKQVVVKIVGNVRAKKYEKDEE